MKNFIGFKPTDQDKKNIDSIHALDDKNQTDTLRKGLGFAKKFNDQRKAKITEIQKDMELFEIMDDEIVDVDAKVKTRVGNILAELLRKSKKSRMREQKGLIKDFYLKYKPSK